MTFDEWRRTKSMVGNICAPEMEIEEAIDVLFSELLDEDFAIAYSCNGKQALAEVVGAVVEKYGKKGK